jgi:hypothetical protein
VKELFSEITLLLSDLEARVKASVGQAGLGQFTIVRGHHQLLDATNLRVDKTSQLSGAAALSGGDSAAAHQRKGNSHSCA